MQDGGNIAAMMATNAWQAYEDLSLRTKSVNPVRADSKER
jgi:hypothetical protein